VIEASYGGFSSMVTDMLAGPGWGWHIETAVHVIRLILGGVFDRYPKLQIVIGHLGESLPFMLQRLDVMPMEMTKLNRPISAYLRENVHYTFSGFNFSWRPSSTCCLRLVSSESCSRLTIPTHQ
jgi:predicted TIM-barrel fold metal-dependent hydrolase